MQLCESTIKNYVSKYFVLRIIADNILYNVFHLTPVIGHPTNHLFSSTHFRAFTNASIQGVTSSELTRSVG